MSNFLHKEAEEIKKQALSEAERLEKQADEKAKQAKYSDAANLYSRAGEYYYTAGVNFKANKCWDAESSCLEMAGKV